MVIEWIKPEARLSLIYINNVHKVLKCINDWGGYAVNNMPDKKVSCKHRFVQDNRI